MIIGANLVAQAVRDAGIREVFLFPGGTIAPVIDALCRLNIACHCLRHEQGAGFAALASARLRNEVRVALVSSGPGVTNIVTCVADAFYDSVPLVVFTGQVGTGDLKRPDVLRQRGFQEVDTPALLGSIAKAVFQPKSPDELCGVLPEAFRLAAEGRPGPVVVDLPMDVQRGEVKVCGAITIACGATRLQPEPVVIQQIVTALSAAKRPVLLAGNGIAVAGAVEELRAFIEAAPMPVTQSLPALGVFPTDHPLAIGFHGHTGNQYAGLAIHNADFVLVVGSRLDIRQTGSVIDRFAPSARVARIELDMVEIAHARVKVDITAHADVRSGLAALRMALGDVDLPDWSDWIEQVNEYRERHPLSEGAKHLLTAQKVIAIADHLTARERLGRRNVIVVTGVGSHQQWAARHFTFDRPRRSWLTSAGHGTMGYDLPAAIGAQFSDPDAMVLCFVGDGSVQMNIQELAAVAEFGLPVKIIVLDNHRFAIVSQFQNLNWGSDPTCNHKVNPDFAAVARAYGIQAFTLSDPSQVEAVLSAALDFPGPALIHCLISPAEDISPMLLAGQTMDEMWVQP
jgi:acetolactate synthase-1/2/3 large subunit